MSIFSVKWVVAWLEELQHRWQCRHMPWLIGVGSIVGKYANKKEDERNVNL